MGNSGEVELSEFSKVFNGLKGSESKKILESLDEDHDGKISLAEFSAAFINRKVSSQQERMWNVFQQLDKNMDGFLDEKELRSAASNLPKKEIEDLIKKVDKDGNGKVSYDEFLDAWYDVEIKKH